MLARSCTCRAVSIDFDKFHLMTRSTKYHWEVQGFDPSICYVSTTKIKAEAEALTAEPSEVPSYLRPEEAMKGSKIMQSAERF